LAFFLRTRNIKSENKFFLLSGVFIPGFFFSFLVLNKDPRYTLPLLSQIAVITSAGVLDIRKKTGALLLVFLVTTGLASFFAVSYSSVELPMVYADSPIGNIKIIGDSDSVYSREAAYRDWKTDEMIEKLINNSKSDNVSVSALPNNPYVWCPLQYELLIRGLRFEFHNVWNPAPVNESFYVITQEGGYIGTIGRTNLSEDVCWN
jgi:hypothetical protein